jgi:hypothetical protein
VSANVHASAGRDAFRGMHAGVHVPSCVARVALCATRELYSLSMRAWDGVRVEWRAYTTCAAQVRPPLCVFAHVHLRACLRPRTHTSHRPCNA